VQLWREKPVRSILCFHCVQGASRISSNQSVIRPQLAIQ
jgi:hypothetical protein